MFGLQRGYLIFRFKNQINYHLFTSFVIYPILNPIVSYFPFLFELFNWQMSKFNQIWWEGGWRYKNAREMETGVISRIKL